MGSSEGEEEAQFQFHEGTQVYDEEPAGAEQEPASSKEPAEAEQEPARIERLLAMDYKGTADHVYKRKRDLEPQGDLFVQGRLFIADEQSTAPSQEPTPKDKGKSIMVDDEPKPKRLKRTEQVQMALDEEVSKRLHEEEKQKAFEA